MAACMEVLKASKELEVEDEGRDNDSSRDLDVDKKVAVFLEHFTEWMAIPFAAKKDEHSIRLNKAVYEDYNELAELLKHNYLGVKKYTDKLFDFAAKTLKKARILLRRKGEPRKKDEIDIGQILIASLSCMTSYLVAITNDFEKDGFDEDFYITFRSAWRVILNDLIDTALNLDSLYGCAMLDVIAAIGNDLYCQVPEMDQKRLIVFLLGYGADNELSANIRAKIGRCLGKLVEFPSLRDDLSFFMDVFALTAKGIVSGENVVKISYAWTFGNLTDAMIEARMAAPLDDKSIGFIRILLHTAIKCTEVPLRGRYSACRACGNVYRWMKFEMLDDSDHRTMVIQITMQLISMVGTGMDYKLRWNAAHALGHALQNDIFFTVMGTYVTDPIIKTLAKWAAQSQNYKERTQCVVSLMKAKARVVFANAYVYVWERICLSLFRLPVEDCESVEKFKVEAVLLVFHLVSLLRYEDLEFIEPTVLKYAELLTTIVLECVPEIPLERLDATLLCKENLRFLVAKTRNSLREEVVSCLVTITNPVCGLD